MRIYFVNESGKKLRFQHCSQFFSRGIQGHTSRTSDSHCAPRGHSARVAFSRDHAGTLGSVSETVAWMSCGTKRPGAHSIHRLSSRSALATISRLVTCLCRHACHRLCAADRNTVMSGHVYGSLLVAGYGVQGSIGVCLLTHITMATSRSNINNFTSINLTTERARLSQLWSNALMIASTRHAVTVLRADFCAWCANRGGSIGVRRVMCRARDGVAVSAPTIFTRINHKQIIHEKRQIYSR